MTSSPAPLIEVEGLTKFYGPVRALQDVSFTVREGEITGFLGPNGAGKSTTLRILAGFLPGDEGSVRVAGYDVRRDSLRVRRAIGYLPEGVPLYPDLRVSEYLKFRARIKGVPRGRRREQIDWCLEATRVQDVRRRIIGTLSRGYRQRVGLADALLGDPKVLLLDEPTVGLDPEQVRQFRALLREVGRERTIVLSTHILPEVELVCTSVVIIDRGRVVASDSAEGVRSRVAGGLSVLVEVSGPAREVPEALRELPQASHVAEEATDVEGYRRFRVWGRGDVDLAEVVYGLARERDWRLRRLEPESVPLEDVFLELVGKDS